MCNSFFCPHVVTDFKSTIEHPIDMTAETTVEGLNNVVVIPPTALKAQRIKLILKFCTGGKRWYGETAPDERLDDHTLALSSLWAGFASKQTYPRKK